MQLVAQRAADIGTQCVLRWICEFTILFCFGVVNRDKAKFKLIDCTGHQLFTLTEYQIADFGNGPKILNGTLIMFY